MTVTVTRKGDRGRGLEGARIQSQHIARAHTLRRDEERRKRGRLSGLWRSVAISVPQRGADIVVGAAQ